MKTKTKCLKPFLGIDRIGGDDETGCTVCGVSKGMLLVIYLGNFVCYLCPICEATLLAMLLSNYTRRKRRGKKVPNIPRVDEVVDAEAVVLSEGGICD